MNELSAGSDLHQYWAAAAVFIAGGNPYDPSQLGPYLVTSQGPISPQNVYIPPFAFPLILPFALFPFWISRAIWFVLSILVVAWVVTRIIAELKIKKLQRVFIYTIVLTFYPLYQCLHLGQLSPFVVLGLYALIQPHEKLQTRGDYLREIFKGITFSLTLIKPQIVVFVYAALIVEFYYGRLRMFTAGFALGSLLLCLITVIINLNIFLYFTKAPIAVHWFTPTIGAWLQSIAPDVSIIRFLPASIAIIMLIVLSKGRTQTPSKFQWAAIYVPLSVLVTPYIWTYDYSALLPAVISIVGNAITEAKRIVLMFIIVLANIGITLGSNNMAYHVWYAGCILALGIYIKIAIRRFGQLVH